MQYREMKNGVKVSTLGFGCMRFPRNGNKIDMEETEREIMKAIEEGVNYFDTAYIYPGSEVALGEILCKNQCREKIHIATKLPHYMVRNAKAMDKYFEEQLSRLHTDYIDFYLIHMLTDVEAWDKLKSFGIEKWIEEKKAEGKIKNLGFSFHGDTETFIKLVDAYDWDFTQIQYNYLDEHSQAGREGLQYAYAKGIPVVIMEPLRGGRLVNNMPESAKQLITSYLKKKSPAEWAFRWLWDQAEVTCVLSGMNTMEMLEENIRIASETQVGELSEEDLNMIEQVKKEINRNTKVGCTGCGYCMPCPKGVDIPNTFRCYNKMYLENKNSARFEYQQIVGMKKEKSDASKCAGCGACEKHCPQHIEIRKELKNANKELQPLQMKLLGSIMSFMMRH